MIKLTRLSVNLFSVDYKDKRLGQFVMMNTEGLFEFFPNMCSVFSEDILTEIGKELKSLNNPKKKLLPFTWEDREQLKGKWVRSKSTGEEFMITHLTKEQNGLVSVHNYYPYDTVKDFEFINGEPFGKYE